VTPHTEFGGFGDPYTFKWSKTLTRMVPWDNPIHLADALLPNVQLSDAGTYYPEVLIKQASVRSPCSGVLAVNPIHGLRRETTTQMRR